MDLGPSLKISLRLNAIGTGFRSSAPDTIARLDADITPARSNTTNRDRSQGDDVTAPPSTRIIKKAKVNQQTHSSKYPPRTKACFRKFLNLPVEIQKMIWLEAIRAGRILEVGEHRDKEAYNIIRHWQGVREGGTNLTTDAERLVSRELHKCPFKAPSPGLLHACSLSRQLAIAEMTKYLPKKALDFSQRLSKAIRFDFEKDILFMSSLQAMKDFLAPTFVGKRHIINYRATGTELKKVKVIAIGSIELSITKNLRVDLQPSRLKKYKNKWLGQEQKGSIETLVSGIAQFRRLEKVVLVQREPRRELLHYAAELEGALKEHISAWSWSIPEIFCELEEDFLGYVRK